MTEKPERSKNMKRRVYVAITLLFFSLVLSPLGVLAQVKSEEQTPPLSLSLGTIRTDAEAAAVNLLIEYTKDLPDIFVNNSAKATDSSGWLLDLSPSIKIETGEKDAFNGVIVKMSGNYMHYYLTDRAVPGVLMPDLDRLFHAVPIALGFESDRRFNNVSALFEIGYVPFYLKGTNANFKLGLNPKVGVFLQTGYKFKGSEKEQSGGAADESKESPNSTLLRLKGNFAADFSLIPFSEGKFGLSILPKATGWYDIANSTFYHSIELVARLTIAKGKHLDFKYQNGSGEPNFNKGDQFGANLTVQF